MLKIVKIFSYILLMLICIFFTGCNNKTNDNHDSGDIVEIVDGLESGFKITTAAEAPALFCAYKSDKNAFDINNVSLLFYYGGNYSQGIDYELENVHNFPSFSLYFTNDEGEKILVKNLNENFVSEKYSCDVEYDKKYNIININYRHSEFITIPKNIFSKENGQIWLEIHSANQRDYEPIIKCITGICIYYKVDGKNVRLSDKLI